MYYVILAFLNHVKVISSGLTGNTCSMKVRSLYFKECFDNFPATYSFCHFDLMEFVESEKIILFKDETKDL